MSQRVKKPGKVEDNNGKRRKRRPSVSEGEEEGTRSGSNSGGGLFASALGGMWTPRHLNDLKVSSIYNRNSAEAPAELYRKDLISAMKLADSEPLTPEEYWLITDPWKQEWEKGVQVPVNPESLPEPEVVVISPVNERSHDFRLPKKKYIRVTHDDFFNPDYHQLVSTAARAEKVCSYDLDDIDASWLTCANADRGMQNLPVISEFLMEQVIEELELQCWEQVQTILKSQQDLGIEFDENVICDVCRSPESEEGNEMVFCDACNICVHQACYGITTIPSGSWLCRTCALGMRPTCVLCPNLGGAMKATRSGQKWAHVACAIWIPEVSIGSVEKMEPITKISSIPASRWSLVCVLCKDKVGACIQCSVKTCKTAYHVTCAFKNGLEMKPIIVDENAEDGIKLRSYCQKHSVNTKKEKSPHSGSEEDVERKKARSMTAEERNQVRAEKLQQIESEFYKYVRLKDVAQNLAVDMDIVMLVYNFWKLKRKSLNNRPLIPPRPETTQLLTQQQEQDLEQMKMFVQLRQDLERVRNLCYMVSRREKLSRSYFRLREQTFQKQVAILGDKATDLLTAEERGAIVAANHGPSIYDQLYSHQVPSSLKDYDALVSLIAGDERKDKVVNGVIKPKKAGLVGNGSNSFKKQFVNGARKKNLLGECSSLSESEASVSDAGATVKKKPGRKPLSYLFDSDSSADGGDSSRKTSKVKTGVRGRPPKSGKKSSSSDSDELELPLSKALLGTSGKSEAPIYSDSDSDSPLKRRPGSPVATKAAMKDFSKNINKSEFQQGAVGLKPGKGRKKNVTSSGDAASARGVAKKATESTKDTESFQKTFEKFKDIATASVQERQKKRNDKPRVPRGMKKPNASKGESVLRSVSAELRDQYEFDGSNDSKNVPSFVPQRQAAKKAAEHIRSGLSNIVAARLIIEDEMEAAATKRKGKGDKNSQLRILAKKGNIKGRSPFRDGLSEESSHAGDSSLKQRGRKRTLSRDDKGPAKGGRKDSNITSAEISASDRTDWPFLDRGSQSACRRSRERSSSSSSSSSSGSSSSDSSSSSRSSASSSLASASPESIATPRKTASLTKSYSTSRTFSFPSSRAPADKSSDRSRDRGSSNEVTSGKKPPSKGRGPGKLRPGGATAGSAYSHSTQSRPSTTSDKHSDGEYRSRKQKVSTSPLGSSDRRSTSPPGSRVNQNNQKPAQEKGKRRKREPSGSKEKEKSIASKFETSSPSKSPAKSQARTTSKTLKNQSKTSGGALDLSSESEQEEIKGTSDEKENSTEPTGNTSRTRTPKPGTTSAGSSVLSPLPSSENKETHLTRTGDTEPDLKRARLDAPDGAQIPAGPGSGPSLFTSTSSGVVLSAKSLFSPRAGHENDIVDFDSELYDLAKSVSADYSQIDEEGGAAASSVPFFSQSFISREQPVEDSPEATLNLVEKLRLQHARKSGCPRSSVEESDERAPDDSSKCSADGADKTVDPKAAVGGVPSIGSTDRNKLVQGDERWVPPSTAEGLSSENHYENRFRPRATEETIEQRARSRILPGGRSDQDLSRIPIQEQKSVDAQNSDVESHVPVAGGVKLPHGMLYSQGTTSSGPGFPPGSVPPNSSFMYPMPGGPSAGPSSPRSSIFRSQTPASLQQLPSSSPSLGYPRKGYSTSSQHFLHSQQGVKDTPVSPQSVSPSTPVNQRRTSFLDEGSMSESIAAGMPPLAKPSIASPSMILAANNVKNITPVPPPQSTVAQIIENVVNNHANNSNLASQELLNVMLGISNSVAPTGQQSVSDKHVTRSAADAFHVGDSDGRTVECNNDYDVTTKKLESPELEDGNKGLDAGKSPRGRGKRASTPRSAAIAKTDKVLPTHETNGVKPGRGKGERKSGAGSSPGRAKPITPAGRARGKGKGKGKAYVPTRKDLAGTVYDIDFDDDFEENMDDKIDLRMLRERRKSSDAHPESKSTKSEVSGSPYNHPLGSSDTFSPKSKDGYHVKSNSSQKTSVSEYTAPILQPPLPPPADVRSLAGGNAGFESIEKSGHGKHDPMKRDTSSVFSSGSDKGSIVDDFDEALEPVTSSKPSIISAKPLGAMGQYSMSGVDSSNFPHSLVLHSAVDTFREGDIRIPNDLSRNQLKVKIKGPFLDANYGSHSIGETSNMQPFSANIHHTAGPAQIVNVPATSNLRRMRKKELLRQYWNQDMNMDGNSSGPVHDSDVPHNSIIHRSVMIPKAVASMAIIPTRDDYKESLPNDDPLTPTTPGLSNITNSKATAAEKRKRNRGIREMAALGILTPDNPRDRRRDRSDRNIPATNLEAIGKKRGKTAKRPIRSTFIPPTLVDSDQSNNNDQLHKKANIFKDTMASVQPVINSNNAVVTAVNHPTPKLKIKFGDLSKGTAIMASVTTTISNHLVNDTSDKEAPSKKAKGRPPKKRGISEITSAASSSMEEYKRESMKVREKIMEEFERKPTLPHHGSKKHKKSKRKTTTLPNERTDEGSSEVKVIAEGSTKLILRFGKNRIGASDGDVKAQKSSEESLDDVGENDSGFTGSSEGSSTSIERIESLSTGATKETGSIDNPKQYCEVVQVKSDIRTTSEAGQAGTPIPESNTPDIKPQISDACSFASDKIMPIRLKLSRCFEGYALKQKSESCGPGDVVPTGGVGVGMSPATNQSDSCEVR